MTAVNLYRIRNEDIRARFGNIADIKITIIERQLSWLGKIARMNDRRLPKKFLTAWCRNNRRRGRPQTSLRHSHGEALQTALLLKDDQGKLADWLPLAKSKRDWQDAVDQWLKWHADDQENGYLARELQLQNEEDLYFAENPQVLLYIPGSNSYTPYIYSMFLNVAQTGITWWVITNVYYLVLLLR